MKYKKHNVSKYKLLNKKKQKYIELSTLNFKGVICVKTKQKNHSRYKNNLKQNIIH